MAFQQYKFRVTMEIGNKNNREVKVKERKKRNIKINRLPS
jgi:hypothetical protein